MHMNHFCRLLVNLLFFSQLLSQDSSVFKYSSVVKIPDLSFINQTYTGLDILEQMDFKPIKGKTIAYFGNHTAINRNGKHLLDLLKDVPDIEIAALFAPEYGLWGIDDKRAKQIGKNDVDPIYGARIIDLFERNVYPPNWLMKKVDLILIDYQDTGVRYSTFMGSMSKLFEAASNWKIPVLILDRPNPLRGDIIDGPIPREEFQSYEAYHLMPIRHGLTIGEASIIINEMGWAKDSKRVELTVIPLANWQRDQWFDETGLLWRHPVPFLRDLNTTLAYTGMDLFRGTNLNIGFGTESPYLTFGAPWLGTSFLLDKLKDESLAGVLFNEINYRPKGSVFNNRIPRYDGKGCSGIKMTITDRDTFDPIRTASTIIVLIEHLHPKQFQWIGDGYIDKLFGSNLLRVVAAQKKPPSYLPPQWMHDVLKFSEFRQPFLLYD